MQRATRTITAGFFLASLASLAACGSGSKDDDAAAAADGADDTTIVTELPEPSSGEPEAGTDADADAGGGAPEGGFPSCEDLRPIVENVYLVDVSATEEIAGVCTVTFADGDLLDAFLNPGAPDQTSFDEFAAFTPGTGAIEVFGADAAVVSTENEAVTLLALVDGVGTISLVQRPAEAGDEDPLVDLAEALVALQ